VEEEGEGSRRIEGPGGFSEERQNRKIHSRKGVFNDRYTNLGGTGMGCEVCGLQYLAGNRQAHRNRGGGSLYNIGVLPFCNTVDFPGDMRWGYRVEPRSSGRRGQPLNKTHGKKKRAADGPIKRAYKCSKRAGEAKYRLTFLCQDIIRTMSDAGNTALEVKPKLASHRTQQGGRKDVQ